MGSEGNLEHRIEIEEKIEDEQFDHRSESGYFSADGSPTRPSRYYTIDFSRDEDGSSRVASEVEVEGGINPAKEERACRICREESGSLIELGCSCINDLAVVHEHCAVDWFKTTGTRKCEICGSQAKNVVNVRFQWELLPRDTNTNSIPNQEANRRTDTIPNQGTNRTTYTAPNQTASRSRFSWSFRNIWSSKYFLAFCVCLVFVLVLVWLLRFKVTVH